MVEAQNTPPGMRGDFPSNIVAIQDKNISMTYTEVSLAAGIIIICLPFTDQISLQSLLK